MVEGHYLDRASLVRCSRSSCSSPSLQHERSRQVSSRKDLISSSFSEITRYLSGMDSNHTAFLFLLLKHHHVWLCNTSTFHQDKILCNKQTLLITMQAQVIKTLNKYINTYKQRQDTRENICFVRSQTLGSVLGLFQRISKLQDTHNFNHSFF